MRLLAYAAVLGLAALTAACSVAPYQTGYAYGPAGYRSGTVGYYDYSANPAINSPIQARTYTASPD